MLLKKAAIAVAVIASFGAGSAMAAQVQSGFTLIPAGAVSNFTVLLNDGTAFGGNNDVTFTWDGTLFTSSSDYTGPGSTSNATLSSPSRFYTRFWNAHSVQMFAPGTYSFDTAVGGGASEAGTLNMTVGAGQYGVHILFDWGGNNNIDIVNVFDLNRTFSNCASPPMDSTALNCLWTGAGQPNPAGNTASTVWTFASTDADGDGVLGAQMVDGGPMARMNANFNLQGTMVVPVPAAAWLLGSGLLGLVGVSRREKVTA